MTDTARVGGIASRLSRPRGLVSPRAAAGAIAAAWAADRLAGDPARLHPVAGFGLVASRLERLMWRPSRLAGALHAAVLVGGVACSTALADHMLAGRPRARWAFRAAVVWATLGGRSLERAALAMRDELAEGRVESARALAPTLVGRDPSDLDTTELSRATVESVAENTSDAVVAPLLWAAVLGAPGAAGYRAVNTLDAMIGHRSHRYERFGWAAARLDDLANWPAARCSALSTIAWAPILGGRRTVAWNAAWRDGRHHPSPNAGRVEGAFAGALSIQLGGTNRYQQGTEHRPLMGVGDPPTVGDIGRAVRLSRLVGLTATLAAIAVARVGWWRS